MSRKFRCINNKEKTITATSGTMSHLNAKTAMTRENNAFSKPLNDSEKELHNICRKYVIQFKYPTEDETKQEKQLRHKRLNRRIKQQETVIAVDPAEIPDCPPSTRDIAFDSALDCVRSFELEQMFYQIRTCKICHERRIDMKMAPDSDSICLRCHKDKGKIKQFSDENNINPKLFPSALYDFSIIEQQLISRISLCITVHMLKHGGIASSGHYVTFPQEINEPAQIFPRLPEEIKIIKVRKQGKTDTSKDFRVRRYTVQEALFWLKNNNPAYSDVIISQERINLLPLNRDCEGVPTVECDENTPILTIKSLQMIK